MKLQDVAQMMLDQHGFFVVYGSRPIELGAIEEKVISPGHMRDRFPEDIHAKLKIVAIATPEDIAKQYALIGEEPPANPWPHVYRAVAE